MKKKFLLLQSPQDVDFFLKQKKFIFKKLIVFDHLTAIYCKKKGIKFLYLNKKKIFLNLKQLFQNASQTSLDIDKRLKKSLKIKDNLFSNFSYFTKDYSFFHFLGKNISDFIKKNRDTDFYYFSDDYKNENYINGLISKIKKKHINLYEIKILNNNYNHNNHYNFNNVFKKNEEKNSFIAPFVFFINVITCFLLRLFKKDIYLNSDAKYKLEDNIVNQSKKLDKFLLFYNPSIFRIKKFQHFDHEFLPDNYLSIFSSFLIYKVRRIKYLIKLLDKIFDFDFFVTQAPTFKNNTLIDFFLKKRKKVYLLLHGGTTGHFIKSYYWPRLYPHITNKKLFAGTYSKILTQKFNKKNNKYFLQKHDLKLSYDFSIKPQYDFCYVLQNNLNVNYCFYQNFNEPFNLYNFRNNFLNLCYKKNKRVQFSYYNSKDDLACINLIKKLKKKKLIKYKIFNFDEMFISSQVIIFEQFSTSFIKAIITDHNKNLIMLDNPNLRIFPDQLKVLKKRAHIAQSYNDILKFIQIGAKKDIEKKALKYFLNLYGLRH